MKGKLILTDAPKPTKKQKLTSKEMSKAFSDFCKHAEAYHNLKVKHKMKEDNPFNWKGELIAIIPKKDYDRFSDGVAFCTGSILEICPQDISSQKILVKADGYYHNIGA